MLQGLEDRVAVITGSTRGWGRGVAEALASRGARVVVNGTTPAGVESAAAAINAAGGTALGVAASVDRPEEAERLMGAAIETYGGIDILVNSTGLTCPAT